MTNRDARLSAAATCLLLATAMCCGLAAGHVLWLWQTVAPQPRPQPPRITAAHGGSPRLLVPEPLGCPADPEAQDFCQTLGRVLRDDLVFEDEFEVLPPDLHELAAAGGAEAPEGWPRTGADAALTARVIRGGDGFHIEATLVDLDRGDVAWERTCEASPGAARATAHKIADEILWSETGVRGVAQTRLAFVSDRLGARRSPTGEMRRVKEVFAADYDGATQVPLTADGDLALTPSWAPDGQAVAYTSYRRGFQDLFVWRPGARSVGNPTFGRGKNWLPAFSPDGSRIAFTSSREGGASVYVMGTDGSDVRRLGHHWGIDTSPAWSPDGTKIAFTSNESGAPRDLGNGRRRVQRAAGDLREYCDKASWSPAPFNEIAYVSQTASGFDIKVVDVTTGRRRQLTFSPGYNESPSWSPNGRHIVFSSTRSGVEQNLVDEQVGSGSAPADLRWPEHDACLVEIALQPSPPRPGPPQAGW